MSDVANKRKPKKKSARALAKKKGKNAKKGSKKEVVTVEKKEGGDDYRSCTGALESRPMARDVKIGGFTLSAYGQELIKDTSLEFTIGRRYGLIGANGAGKSSLLQAIANREIPIPEHIDIFFLDNEAPATSMTALEYVVAEAKLEMERLEAEVEKALIDLGPDDDYTMDLYGRLDEMDPDSFEPDAAMLLNGLGFGTVMANKHTKDMSGGWRMRVALAQALFIKPTLLLLDEPTNHLDLEACVWLEDYLSTYDRCLLVVSHSQDFLNGVCTNIMHLTEKLRLHNYSGNYDVFVQTKKELEVNQMKRYKKEQDDIVHLKKFISSCGTFSNLVKQAKSKQKILDKMYAKGLVEKVTESSGYNFRFNICDDLPGSVLSFQNVSFSYSGLEKDLLYKNVSVGVDMESRVALVGPNGAGKSTLLKLMMGELMPNVGAVRRHVNLSIGRYHQHSKDELPLDMTPLNYMRMKYESLNKEETEWRQYLGRFGIGGSLQTKPIKTLSDGLKSRIVFATLAVGHPQLLLLDEPTNHLDLECIDSLAIAINSFKGGMVVVSHDFRLIEQVAKEIWVCDHMSVTRWDGDIRSYKKALIADAHKALK